MEEEVQAEVTEAVAAGETAPEKAPEPAQLPPLAGRFPVQEPRLTAAGKATLARLRGQ